VVGYIDVASADRTGDLEEPARLGDLTAFRDLCRDHRIERVIIAFAALGPEDLLDTVRASNALGLKISIVPRLFEVLGRSLVVDEVEGMSLLAVPHARRGPGARGAKRAMDIVGSALLLLVFAPAMLAIALAIKVSSGGPVLFSQVRVGRANRRFRMFKFRTMIVGADALKGDLEHLNEAPYPLFKIADDPRVTRVGRVIRRLSLDELPQLWNVLRGDMSLVGPRPLVPAEDEQVIGWHRARLDISPGLTGQWQVMGRTAIPLSEMVKLDYRYIADWSLWNDLKLLVRTAPVVLLRRGL
jgi:exopolysaccharide biosynthesis polyprenyl glycosylphosphotransferase